MLVGRMKDGPKSQRSIRFRRWRSIIACGVVAAAVVILAEPLLRSSFDPVVEYLADLPADWIFAALWTLLLAVAWGLGRERWIGFLGWKHIWAFPPLWIAFLVAAVVVCLPKGTALIDDLTAVLKHAKEVSWWVPLYMIASVVVIALSQGKSLIGSSKSGQTEVLTIRLTADMSRVAADGSRITTDFDLLKEWIANDDAVETPDYDAFGHATVAQRIADRLRQHPEASIHLIGELGSGKSTICQLVRHELAQSEEFKFVRISLWPFDSAESAVRGLLNGLVSEIGKQVNDLSLVGLPGKYVSVIESTSGLMGAMVRLADNSESPEDIIRRLSDITVAVGITVVVWIEDFERFAGSPEEKDGVETSGLEERTRPLESLLYLLDAAPGICVVQASTGLRFSFDRHKIARFVEEVPEMDVRDVSKIISLLRERCLNGYPRSIVNASTAQEFGTPNPYAYDDGLVGWFHVHANPEPTILECCTKLCKTPRQLKSVLRLVLESWEALAGEIDLDAVIVASVIRVCAPGLFAELTDQRVQNLLRHGIRNSLTKNSDQPHAHELIQNLDRDLLSYELRRLVCFIFPELGRKEHEVVSHVATPQRFFVSKHVNNWKRYLSGRPVPTEQSDQLAIQSIRQWVARQRSDLIDRVMDEKGCKQIEAFVNQFDGTALCRLLEEVCHKIGSNQTREETSRTASPNGVSCVWSMMQHVRPQEAELLKSVRAVVFANLPRNLPLALEVHRMFTHEYERTSQPLSFQQREFLANQTCEEFLGLFTGIDAAAKLQTAMGNASPWFFERFVPELLHCGRDQSLYPKRWERFCPTLLEIAEKFPSVGSVWLVLLVTNRRPTMVRKQEEGELPEIVPASVAEFNEELARVRFGSQYDRLMKLLATHSVPADSGEAIMLSSEAVQDAARQYLEPIRKPRETPSKQ